jgi:alpha-galactosidase
MPIKIAVIGAGSLTFTRTLVRDILAVPELQDARLAFTDIHPRYLEMAERLCQRDIEASALPARITATTRRRAALEGARYVINCVRVGGLEAFRQDIEIPLKYGVDQCVGDTLCVGGILYGQRGIPVVLDFCKDIREVAADGCLMLNYANPNAMLTWAANEVGGVNTVGLCHGVQGGHHQIAQVIELLVNKGRAKSSPSYIPVMPKEVDIICAGLNHQTWYIRVLYRGQDWTGRLLEGFEKHPVYSRTEKVRIDVLRRFGYFSTESNGHLSEYLPWYRKRPRDIRKWIDVSAWIHGQTGGYLRYCLDHRHQFERDFPKWMAQPAEKIAPAGRSGEHGSYIIEGLETGRVYRGHFNVVNQGCISNLPADCVVEVPGYVDKSGIGIPRVGALPLACVATLSATVSVQRMAVYAAVAGDAALLKQAVLHDPLTAAVCDGEEVWQMVDEMLVAQRKWLPQFRTEIPAARKRLSAARRRGDYRGTSKSKGTMGMGRIYTPR